MTHATEYATEAAIEATEATIQSMVEALNALRLKEEDLRRQHKNADDESKTVIERELSDLPTWFDVAREFFPDLRDEDTSERGCIHAADVQYAYWDEQYGEWRIPA